MVKGIDSTRHRCAVRLTIVGISHYSRGRANIPCIREFCVVPARRQSKCRDSKSTVSEISSTVAGRSGVKACKCRDIDSLPHTQDSSILSPMCEDHGFHLGMFDIFRLNGEDGVAGVVPNSATIVEQSLRPFRR